MVQLPLPKFYNAFGECLRFRMCFEEVVITLDRIWLKFHSYNPFSKYVSLSLCFNRYTQS